MGNLADAIERYLRELLAERRTLEVKRRELAMLFRCVPSQINYVLDTRFTPARGYAIESRRGGGGFIRITRIRRGGYQPIPGERIDQEQVGEILTLLMDEGTIDRAEAMILQELLGEDLAGERLDAGVARAKVLHAILLLLVRRDMVKG